MNKKDFFYLLITILLISLPIIVYKTYPDVIGAAEVIAQEEYLPKVPFKAPGFLHGSIIYSLRHEEKVVDKTRVLQLNHHLYIMKDGEVFLVRFAPFYKSVSTNKVLSVNQLVELMKSNDYELIIQSFASRKKILNVVVEVRIGSDRYVAVVH